MRAHGAFAIALMATLVSCNKTGASQSDVGESAAFPQKGNYQVVHETTQGGESHTEEYDVSLDVSDQGKLADQLAEDDGTNCRDKHVTINGGSFNVRMTCDAPDGDFHNIAVTRQGTYSRDSMDLTADMTLLGMQSRERYSYRLKAS